MERITGLSQTNTRRKKNIWLNKRPSTSLQALPQALPQDKAR